MVPANVLYKVQKAQADYLRVDWNDATRCKRLQSTPLIKVFSNRNDCDARGPFDHHIPSGQCRQFTQTSPCVKSE